MGVAVPNKNFLVLIYIKTNPVLSQNAGGGGGGGGASGVQKIKSCSEWPEPHFGLGIFEIR